MDYHNQPVHRQRFNQITLMVASVVGVLLFYRACTTTLLCDELLFLHSIDLGFEQGLFQQGSSHPPLLRLFIGSFADSSSPDWLLRLPSVLFAVATVVVWSRILMRMIPDQITRCLLLPAMAFNPVWLQHGYQCLPYAALTLFASLHCWAFLRLYERNTWQRSLVFIVTGVVLPWIHFFGVNVLIADQVVWLLLLLRQYRASDIPASEARNLNNRLTVKQWFLINLSIAAFTLPVVPIAAFYIWNDRPYPLAEVSHYCTYFVTASSLFFSMVSFPGIETGLPFFLVLYLAVLYYLRSVYQRTSTSEQPVVPPEVGMIGIGGLLAGFTATQVHSMMGQTAMFPRYMLAGAWMHLPLIAMLLLVLANKHWSRYAVLFLLLGASTSLSDLLKAETHDQRVAQFLKEQWAPRDAFLVQSFDLWTGDNHFDQLWFDRYVDPQRAKVTGPQSFRLELQKQGLPAPLTQPNAERVWVYSHLFRGDFLKTHTVPGWELVSMYDFGGPYPLALLQRQEPQDAAEGDVAANL